MVKFNPSKRISFIAKRLFFIKIFVIITLTSLSQTTPPLPKLIPASPDAASLGRFGDIPVSYSTGLPEISIPIYQINIGKIQQPISLNYHAGGVRVNDISSSVGIGWSLNAGGVITRSVVGKADETGYLTLPTESDLLANTSAYYGPLYLGSDWEPDVFNFNINGQSGKFYFNKDQSVFQIPLSNNKIEYIPATQTAQGYFKITDVNGLVYLFDKQEWSSTNGTDSYISAWRLSKITDINTQDQIVFNYEQGSDFETIRSDAATFTNTPNCSGSAASFSYNLLQTTLT
ncbi:hypothetical protein DBR11_26710, partial [Pedobacter sp. HMWF019]|uniref:hypothetical protein n=1 Tax=Pedobacter sp. HMWF019 TaxID=2056856 RepID=UPI000D4C55E4